MAQRLLFIASARHTELRGRRVRGTFRRSRHRGAAGIETAETPMITIVVVILAVPVLRKYVFPLFEGLRDVADRSPRARRQLLL
jgi:hypothetical protein